ncbi:MAG: 7TM diverse intracellular signaling domain-containing protein [Bacteroidota bacterium]
MNLNKQLLLLLLIVFCRLSGLKANHFSDTLQINSKQFRINTNPYLNYFHDSSKTLSIDEISKKEFRRNSDNTPNLGFTGGNHWFYLVVKNNYSDAKPLLEIQYPFYDTINVYIQYENTINETFTSGDCFKFNSRPIDHKNFIYPLNIEKGKCCKIFVELKCNGEATSFPATVSDPESLNKKDNKETILLGIYYGILLFAFFLSFFLGNALGERSHFYYILYLISLTSFQGSLDGISFQYLWPNYPWIANHVIPFSGSLSLVFLLLFSDKLLLISSQNKFSKQLFNFILVSLITLALLSLLNGFFYSLSIKLISVSALLVDLYIFFGAIRLYKQQSNTARFFILGFGFLLVMILIVQIKNFGLLPRVFITEFGIHLGSLLEVILLTFALADRVRSLQLEKNKAQKALLLQQEETIAIQQSINEKLEQIVIERTKEVVSQKEIIEEKNKDITDSINYAERIQRGVLKSEKQLQKIFEESFILFKPKDIVSGDFYWFSNMNITPISNNPSQPLAVIAVIDCTGHGIPGAFMSMVGNTILNQTLKDPRIKTPADALNYLNEEVKSTLLKKDIHHDTDLIKDGMDISMIAMNLHSLKMSFAGANNSCWIVRSNSTNLPKDFIVNEFEGNESYLIELKPNKQAIGVNTNTLENPFTNAEIQLEKGDAVYLFSDGYADQFGGEKNKKFGSKKLKEVLANFHKSTLLKGEQHLLNIHYSWKGDNNQVDDICILGIRI